MYMAHSANKEGFPQPLREHLLATAKLARCFAAEFGAAKEAEAAGLLHDLGKYGERFQARLRGDDAGIDHWTAGAVAALERLRAHGVATALAIHGHHLGLQQATKQALREMHPQCWPGGEHPQQLKLSDDSDHAILVQRFTADGLELPAVDSTVYGGLGAPAAGAMLDVRMLYSALVDADYLDTEAHFQGPRPTGPELQPERDLDLLTQHLQRIAANSTSAGSVNDIRQRLLENCLVAADRPPGLFTLTAPTGAGKTLAMLAFALRHAVQHGLRRIVVVIPYLTIIEQTVDVYRNALAEMGDKALDTYILEDHSLAGNLSGGNREDEDGDPRRLLAENWDAPIVITTSVQCLESLFANRSRPCRKLHRLARSVLLFDEVQTIPTRLAVPTLATLSHLAGSYGATVVFATATQPAFGHLDPAVRALCPNGWQPREIVSDHSALFQQARRVRVSWPEEQPAPKTWDELAQEVAGAGVVLCVVNLKRHALSLFEELARRGTPGLFHLSTNLCPAHRRQVVMQVRRRLKAWQPCVLVSTQCVEAGVDVDFPVVYRAWGPLDAIAQVAGRCNRNGRRRRGEMRLFFPVDDGRLYPGGAYQQAADVAAMLLRERGAGAMDLDDPQLHAEYYRRLYDVQQLANPTRDDELLQRLATQHFADVSRHYRLIEHRAISLLVAYDRHAYDQLAGEVRERGLTRDWVKRARPHAVNLFAPRKNDAIRRVLQSVALARTREPSEDWFIHLAPDQYDHQKGLMLPTEHDPSIA